MIIMITNEITIKLKDHNLLLRTATKEDAQMLIDYLKITSKETRFLLKEPEEITFTVEEECQFIETQNNSKYNLMLLGFLDGEYVGNCSFTGIPLSRYQHRVTMGIALYQKYTGMGIGTAMIETLCKIAKEKGFEQMELEVVADNKNAIALYKKMGFEIFGTFPNHNKYKDGSYADSYFMVKQLKF